MAQPIYHLAAVSLLPLKDNIVNIQDTENTEKKVEE